MGLNDSYDALCNQILVLDPLLIVYKAYSMALGVEKQREIQMNFTNSTDVSVMLVRSTSYNNNTMKSFRFKSRNDSKGKNNNDHYHDHCKVNDHSKDACFKIYGYPDWYKEQKEKRKSNMNYAHMANKSCAH